MPEENAVIQQLPVERDEMGFWTHPAWPRDGDEDAIPKTWFAEKGLEVICVEMESDGPAELVEKWFDEGGIDCTAWAPSTPAGKGWFIFSIHDTDDGPICVWIRPEPKGYAYSTNGEDWTADWCSFLSQNDELAPGDECQRGEIHYADPAEFVDSDAVIEAIADNAASSDLGEWADDFPTVSAEAKQELEDLLDAWARKNCDCSFYRVKNIETFAIAAEDLDQAEVTP